MSGAVAARDPTLYNEDLAAIPAERRTWTTYNYASLWVAMSVCIPTYMLASGLIAGGMSWKQAIGTIRQAAQKSSLSEYPLEITDGTAHVDALSTALADFGKVVRKDIDRAGELGDQDTADLLTEISREIDKQLWFVEAHIQA